MSNGLLKTPLYDTHMALGAKMTGFAGWNLPLQYAGIREEHRAVRQGAGLFDVSHMGEIDVSGANAAGFLNYLLTRDMLNRAPGRALYSPMCNQAGGTVDDLIVYPLAAERFLLVVNASNVAADLTHIQSVAASWAAAGNPPVSIENQSSGFAQLALQGPASAALLTRLMPAASALRPFQFFIPTDATGWLVSRTGYTGEDGFEIYLPPSDALAFWDELVLAGAVPAGLGARDTLRLEAALPLHGHEIAPDISPLEAGLDRFVFLEKPEPGFIGQALLRNPRRRLIGLKAQGRSIPRSGYSVLHEGRVIGHISSGGYSPTLELGIALALVDADAFFEDHIATVLIRDKEEPFEVCSLPFVKRSKP